MVQVAIVAGRRMARRIVLKARTKTAVFPISEATQARDAHRAATILMLLVFLWGAISLLEVPWEPFWIPNLAQTVVCAGGLVYLLLTWKRPRPRVACFVSAILIVYSLALLPWTAVMWCRLGRPLEAFIVPRVALISIALVLPARWSLGLFVMSLFAAESAFVFIYARHVGLEAAIPTNEPLATLCFAILGVGLLALRRHRQDLAQKHINVQAEIHALDRTRPVLTRASSELAAQVDAVTAVLETSAGRVNGKAPGIRRAVDRLGALSRELCNLIIPNELRTTGEQAEQALLDRDAQLGAILFAALAATIALPMTFWGWSEIGTPLSWILVVNFGLDFGVLLYLARTWRQPSSQRSLWAVLAIFATALLTTNYVQHQLLVASEPFVPFLGHKLLMCVLGLTLTTRFRLGVVLVVASAANAIGLWFLLNLHAHTHLVTVSEPWLTLIYMTIGLVCLRMHEQRKLASLQLLRAETVAAAMQRRARMFLALRDRLNTPLQTLVFAGSGLQLPARENERIEEAVNQLLRLSRELAELDTHMPSTSTTVDADRELRRLV